jgi:hypothetical protein
MKETWLLQAIRSSWLAGLRSTPSTTVFSFSTLTHVHLNHLQLLTEQHSTQKIYPLVPTTIHLSTIHAPPAPPSLIESGFCLPFTTSNIYTTWLTFPPWCLQRPLAKLPLPSTNLHGLIELGYLTLAPDSLLTISLCSQSGTASRYQRKCCLRMLNSGIDAWLASFYDIKRHTMLSIKLHRGSGGSVD